VNKGMGWSGLRSKHMCSGTHCNKERERRGREALIIQLFILPPLQSSLDRERGFLFSRRFQSIDSRNQDHSFLLLPTIPLPPSPPSHPSPFIFMAGSLEAQSSESTNIYRVPQCMSPRRNWDSPTPALSPASVPLPPVSKVGEHTRLRVRGWGSPNYDD
jgi:hypothetical protein